MERAISGIFPLGWEETIHDCDADHLRQCGTTLRVVNLILGAACRAVMDDVARLPARDRSDLFVATARRRALTAETIEKDFWVPRTRILPGFFIAASAAAPLNDSSVARCLLSSGRRTRFAWRRPSRKGAIGYLSIFSAVLSSWGAEEYSCFSR